MIDPSIVLILGCIIGAVIFLYYCYGFKQTVKQNVPSSFKHLENSGYLKNIGFKSKSNIKPKRKDFSLNDIFTSKFYKEHIPETTVIVFAIIGISLRFIGVW